MINVCKLFLLFIIYSFLGWVVEVTKVSIKEKKIVNRGFLIGPSCPIYACGAVLITCLTKKYENDFFIRFILCVIICSIIEYFASYILEKVFKVKWWDYSDRKYNINGRITLSNLLGFGFLSVIVLYILNPFFMNLIDKLPNNVIYILSTIIFGIFVLDLVVSIFITYHITIVTKEIITSTPKDSTNVIKSKVFKILKENYFTRRIIKAFPDIKIIKENYLKVGNKIKSKLKRKK